MKDKVIQFFEKHWNEINGENNDNWVRLWEGQYGRDEHEHINVSKKRDGFYVDFYTDEILMDSVKLTDKIFSEDHDLKDIDLYKHFGIKKE